MTIGDSKDDDGIWSIENEMVPSPSCINKGPALQEPPAEKTTHDETERNHRARQSSGYEEASSGSNDSHTKDNARAGETLPVRAAVEETEKQAHHDFKFGDNQVSCALLARLSELRASAPWLVDTKRLQSTDARSDQNRLQLSGRSPLSRAFTDTEKALARSSDGMLVTAFDRGGHEYGMTCKLWKEKHYRFMGQGWKDFREAHDLTIPKGARLTRRVAAELWGFRSRALPPPEGDKDVGEASGPAGHPGGALGLVVLLRDDGGEEEAVAEKRASDESPADMFLLLMAATALQTLRTGDGPKRKRDDH